MARLAEGNLDIRRKPGKVHKHQTAWLPGCSDDESRNFQLNWGKSAFLRIF